MMLHPSVSLRGQEFLETRGEKRLSNMKKKTTRYASSGDARKDGFPIRNKQRI
ncbi:2729_t:CDS:1, partial [Paraglomus brasilianum]